MSALSEFESMDTLPFVKDTIPNAQDKVIAPTIDEVDDDPEGLRDMRGHGRYFGIAGEDGINEGEPKCNNCSQRGHLKRNCPHVICSYCGAMDNHYSQHCLKVIKCSNCNESGHYRSQCPHKWRRVFCALCSSKRHSRDRCPSIWRVYISKNDRTSRHSVPMHAFYCYNCGSKGHLGDECNSRRSSRVPNDDGSAFSGDNLLPELKEQYFQNLRKQVLEREEKFDYNDYEFDDALYDDEPVQRRQKSSLKRRKHNNNNNNAKRRRFYPTSIQPIQRGATLPPATRRHPLDFARNGIVGNRSQNTENSRYDRASSRLHQQSSNYKNYSSFKPFRSGTLNMRR